MTAWTISCNQTGNTVDWRFTTEDARIKLKTLYPCTDREAIFFNLRVLRNPGWIYSELTQKILFFMKNNITIFSWNINRNNFLNEEKFLIFKHYDVIFLQEVSLSSLNFLMSFSDIYEIFYAREILKTFNKNREYFWLR